LRLLWDLIDCHEESQGISYFQEGNEMRSLWDLIDCQEGNKKFPICQVGMGTEMRVSESLMNSEVSSYQQGMLIGADSYGSSNHVNEDDDKLKTCIIQEEDQRNILMIGGIGIFLPHSPVEAEICVAYEATTIEERQPAMTIKEELEQVLEVAQAEEEDEHFEEWLNNFSQEAEKTIEEEEEEADSMRFADLCEQIEALEKGGSVGHAHPTSEVGN
jgi:hypothetical protein